MGKNRRRIYALVGAAAVAGALLAVAPALGADPAPDHVSFEANHAQGPRFTYGTSTQVLSTETRPSTCKLGSTGDQLVTLLGKSASGSDLPVGLQDLGIGVRSTGNSANGSPCSQVDANERLTIEASGVLLGRSFEKVKLDLEMTGNAIVVLTLSSGSDETSFNLHTGTNFDVLCDTSPESPGCTQEFDSAGVNTVHTGAQLDSACLKPQNSGPSSNVNDNCIWTVEPGFEFDKITLTTTVGTVSLEGGSETGTHSKFYLADSAPVATNQTEYIDYTETGGEPDSHVFVLVASGISLTVVENSLGYTDDDAVFQVGLTRAGGSVSVVDPVGKPLDVTYTPPEDFTGSDFFEYTVSDTAGRTASATVTVYELFNCGETLGLNEHGVTANYTRLFPVGEDPCADDGKPYDLSIDNSDPAKPVVVFVPRSIGDPLDCSLVECPRFSAELIFPPRPATPGLSNTGTLQWYPDATVGSPDPEAWIAMPWCLSAEVGMVGVQRAVLNAELPPGSGEGWCIGFVETRPAVAADFEDGVAIADHSVTTWYVYGIGDPLKRVS